MMPRRGVYSHQQLAMIARSATKGRCIPSLALRASIGSAPVRSPTPLRSGRWGKPKGRQSFGHASHGFHAAARMIPCGRMRAGSRCPSIKFRGGVDRVLVWGLVLTGRASLSLFGQSLSPFGQSLSPFGRSLSPFGRHYHHLGVIITSSTSLSRRVWVK